MNPQPGQETIPVTVSPQTAAYFRSLPKVKRDKLEAILRKTLEDAVKGKESKPTLGVQSTLLSEAALSQVWDTPEEDEAWRDL